MRTWLRSHLPAGALFQRITIEQATLAEDDAGQPIETWETGTPFASNVPAKLESVSGGEMIRGKQVSAEATTMFTVRYRTDLDVRMRVLYSGRRYGIVRIEDPFGDQKETRIECRDS